MTVGRPTGKAEIDAMAGQLAIMIRDALRQASDFCDLLNNTAIIPNDAFLTGLGYTAGEVTTLRAAFTDAKALRLVANGTNSQASPNNFLFNLQKLTGTAV